MLLCKNFAVKKSLRVSGFKEPLQMAGIMMLFILGVVMFPTRRIVGLFYHGENEFVFLFADAIERLAFTGMMIHFARQLGFKLMCRKTCIIDVLIILPALLIAINNFPFVSYFSGVCKIENNALNLFVFALWCVGVGTFEEVAFRGVIMPLTLIKLKDTKRPALYTVIVSSAVFSLTHLVNLLNGNIGGTLFQVCYTLLIGSMCGIVTAKTGNVFISALVHVVYNFGGMVGEYCGNNAIWTYPQIAFTAVVGTVFGIYLFIVLLKCQNGGNYLYEMLGDTDDVTEYFNRGGALPSSEENNN